MYYSRPSGIVRSFPLYHKPLLPVTLCLEREIARETFWVLSSLPGKGRGIKLYVHNFF